MPAPEGEGREEDHAPPQVWCVVWCGVREVSVQEGPKRILKPPSTDGGAYGARTAQICVLIFLVQNEPDTVMCGVY